MASFVLPFFPLDVLDEIWDLIESISEGFLTYSCQLPSAKILHSQNTYFRLFPETGFCIILFPNYSQDSQIKKLWDSLRNINSGFRSDDSYLEY